MTILCAGTAKRFCRASAICARTAGLPPPSATTKTPCTQGTDAADAAANVEKYGKWVDALKK